MFSVRKIITETFITRVVMSYFKDLFFFITKSKFVVHCPYLLKIKIGPSADYLPQALVIEYLLPLIKFLRNEFIPLYPQH